MGSSGGVGCDEIEGSVHIKIAYSLHKRDRLFG